MPRQLASVQGHGNVVVQLVGDGNAINWQPDKPSLWLATYDSSLLSEIRIKSPQDGLHPGYTATGCEELGILSPFTRSLTLLGRDGDLHALAAWLEGPDPISVQVVVGGGGRGKTRLAQNFAIKLKTNGWPVS
jgi:hypothetical protein